MNVEYTTFGNMGITFGCSYTGMAKKGLDITDVSAIFKQMSGESVPEAVD